MFVFLTVLQVLVAAALVAVVLMQRSESGGLGGGGSPSGFMSARGAADFLTRATSVLAAVFVALSIVLAALAIKVSSGRRIDTSLDRAVPVSAPAPPTDPLAGAARPAPAVPATAPTGAPAPDDPLAGAARR